MSYTIHTDLSDEGDLPKEGSGFIFCYRVFVQDTGSAHPIEGLVASRWLDIGWCALYENITEELDQGPAAHYYLTREWVEFLSQTFVTKYEVDSISAVDGLHYKFKPGVVATIVMFEE